MGWREAGETTGYLPLHCHHQGDICIIMGTDESRFMGLVVVVVVVVVVV